MRRMYEQFKEPYVGIWLFWRPSLIVNSPEIAKNILVKDSALFRNRFVHSGSTDPIGKLNIFTLNDPLWSQIRKRLSVLFTGSKMRGLQNLVTKKSNELVERIENERKKSKFVDMRMLFTDYTTDVIGTASFGVVSDATLTGESALRNVTKDFMKFDIYRGLCWCSVFFFPEMVNVFRFSLFPKQTTEYLRKVFRTIVDQRGGFETKVTEPKDLVDVLIKIKQDNHNSEDFDMTEDMMVAQASVFLQGGFDTTATTLTFALYELAYHPEIQEKLRKELQEAKEKHGDNLLEANVLSQLTYLNCVINEGLRKYPIMGWLDRVSTVDYKIDDHLTITAGTPVYVNAVGMHYDPDIYPEPDTFNPDRFLPENEGNIKPYSYLPFGEGPRKCIGQRFGLSNARHALAAVMLKYELRVIPNTPRPSEVKLERKGLFLSPEETLSVEFVPRN
ncbi:cytochrome P450 6k1-like isoform X2 [Epargyreus clarus]